MLDKKEITDSIKHLRSSVRGKVHEYIQVRVENICTLVEEILTRADQLDPSSQELHTLSKMTTDYLPRTLKPYLALPRDYAEQNVFSDGQTAAYSLCIQLDLLYTQTYHIFEEILRLENDKLLANQRFLQDKFGQSSLDLQTTQGPLARRQGTTSQTKTTTTPKSVTEIPRDQTPPKSSDKMLSAILLYQYKTAIEKDTVTEDLATQVVSTGLLTEGEVVTLVTLWGEKVARAALDLEVSSGSALHVTLANRGYYVNGTSINKLTQEQRGSAAQNSTTPAAVLLRLASDVDESVRSGVAQNPNAPEKALIKLAGDEALNVRSCVAQNPRASVELCLTIYKDLLQHDLVSEAITIALLKRNIISQAEADSLMADFGLEGAVQDTPTDVRSIKTYSHVKQDLDYSGIGH